MLTAEIPAFLSAGNLSFNRIPFVVSVTCSIPGIRQIISARSSIPFRTSGSPPVSLILEIPSSAPIRHTLAISSNVRISS
jgi:hypothetical protein